MTSSYEQTVAITRVKKETMRRLLVVNTMTGESVSCKCHCLLCFVVYHTANR